MGSTTVVSFQMISGVCLGLELYSGQDVDDPDLGLGISFDLLIFRINLEFYRGHPDGLV
jgi:hypothetical protein